MEYIATWDPPQGAKFACLELEVPNGSLATIDWCFGPKTTLLRPRVAKTAAYTVDEDDMGWIIEGQGSSAFTITLPNDSAIPVGGTVYVFQQTTGVISVATASGVTMRFDDGTSGTAKSVAISARSRAKRNPALGGASRYCD